MTKLLTVKIARDEDVVSARQRARQVAEALGFDAQQQTRLATAVSESPATLRGTPAAGGWSSRSTSSSRSS